MPYIKCTAKLAKRAGLKLSAPEVNSPHDWHANIFTLQRRFYVMFCHDLSRFSCLAGSVKKADLQDLPGLLGQSLAWLLPRGRFSGESQQRAVSRVAKLSFSKTNSRSVLGTITDNIFRIELHADDILQTRDVTLEELAECVNEMPMAILDYYSANDAYRAYLSDDEL